MKKILLVLLVSGVAVATQACGKKNDLEPPEQFRQVTASAEF